MHVVARLPRRRVQRTGWNGGGLHSPARRIVVNDRYLGLGEVDGLFNIGKMFTRMFTITPSSFKFKNIAGAIGSFTAAVSTGGLAPIVSEFAKGKGASFTSAHSKPMEYLGYGTMAAAAVVGGVVAAPAIGAALGVGGTAATGVGLTATVGSTASGSAIIGAELGTAGAAASGGFMSTVGSVLGTVGSGLMSVVKGIGSVLPVLGGVLGGGGGGQVVVQQGADPYAQQYADQYAYQQQQAAQAAYDAQVRAQQNAMYAPPAYQNIPSTAYAQPASMNTSYGDLRSPYTAITEDGEQIQIDPATGQPIQPGISTPMLIGGGALVLLVGWYLMSGK